MNTRTRTLYTILIAIVPMITLSAQIRLEECHEKAIQHFPLSGQKGLIAQSEKYTLSAAAKAYIPQISISAKASYQSDVTALPIAIPGLTIPLLNKDQYQAVAELYQPIYDGGTYRWQKREAKASAVAESKSLEVSLFAIRERVNQLFFGLLLIQEQIKLSDLMDEELKRNLQKVEHYINNGTANSTDRDRIQVEILKVKQRKAELNANEQTYRRMLSLFIGQEIDANTPLMQPNGQYLNQKMEINRPEIAFYNAQREQLDAQLAKIQSSYLPRMGLFVQGGYGSPGLNMLHNGFEPIWVAGLKLSWNLAGLYTKGNQDNLIRTKQKSIELQQNTFIFNTNIQVKQHSGEIEKYDQLLIEDDKIIALRENIAKAGETKLANGTQSVTDHLKEINETDQARAEKVLHQIQKLMHIYNLKNSTNNY